MVRRQLFIALLIGFTVHSKVIIWDLGDTLFGTSYFTFARKIGLRHFLSYMLLDWRNPNVKPIVFDVLEKMNPSEEYPKEIATDNEGNPLPVIMNHWLAGIISGEMVIQSIREYFTHLDAQKYFASKRQRRLVLKTIEQMFSPSTLVAATYPIIEGIELLHDCYHARNADGALKNSLFVLSNWDDISFKLLKKRYADIFDAYFENHHIVISGAIGLIKPKKEAFAYVLKTYHLDPKECIFIDDQYDNILAAQEVGITSLLMCKGNYTTLRNILIKLEVL